MQLQDLKTGSKFFDCRYNDYYQIAKIDGKSLDNCFLTLVYDKGREILESARFVLYCIEAKQHLPKIV